MKVLPGLAKARGVSPDQAALLVSGAGVARYCPLPST